MRVRVKVKPLQTFMARQSLNQRMFAKLVGVDPSLISLWFREERCPGAAVRQRLLAILGVTFDDIFSINGTRRRQKVRATAPARERRTA
jgi:transcriptional regulator with XRE-family HTH domain